MTRIYRSAWTALRVQRKEKWADCGENGVFRQIDTHTLRGSKGRAGTGRPSRTVEHPGALHAKLLMQLRKRTQSREDSSAEQPPLICSWHRGGNQMYLDPGCCPAWSGPQAGHLQVYYFLFLLDSRDRRRRSKLSFLYMERVKVDGGRTRPKNKQDPSKDNSFSTVRGTRLGGSCVSGLIVCYNYSENLTG